MATKKKLLQAAAGTAAAGGAAALNVEDVFSTYLYEGNTYGQAIENGINLGQSYGSGSMSMNLKRLDLGTLIALSGDFTLEAWIFIQDAPDGYLNILGSSSASGYNFQFGKDNSNRLTLYNNGGFLVGSTTSNQIPFGEWVHVAVSRSGTTIYFFVNGTLLGTATDSTTYRWNQVGNVLDTYYEWDGYMSGLRILDGTALYTSAFTAPTSNLTAITNTVLLLGQGDTPLVDESTSSVSITNTGVTASTFGPHDAADAGEGGLVWLKARSQAYNHNLFDTERGIEYRLNTNTTNAQVSASALEVTSSGFVLTSGLAGYNYSGDDHVSWTWRKAPKFFDVVTYTGNGTAGRTVSHNLGSVPGMIIIKRTDNTNFWVTYHRSTGNSSILYLNLTNASQGSTVFNSTTPTDSVFTLSASSEVNISGGTYVAYLFAHNDGDASFGPDGDADIIKCGSYTGNGSTNGPEIDLGFEPQWVMIKNASSTGTPWYIMDSMRGIVAGLNDRGLFANTSDAESVFSGANVIDLTATGFDVKTNSSGVNGNGHTMIYIAIRRGPMAVPESATDVFAQQLGSNSTNPSFTSNFPVDMGFFRNTTADYTARLSARLMQGKYLSPASTAAESTNSSSSSFDFQDGYSDGLTSLSTFQGWMWRRAPSFFDVVAYTGTDVYDSDIAHNLGVAPEMIWVKNRNRADSAAFWAVYHKDLTATDYMQLNSTSATATSSGFWADTEPTATHFTIGNQAAVNSTDKFIAYLFASVAGVSKVGSYTGNGTNQTIDCGFSSGARFILVKRTDTTGDWYVWDTERGIVAGNDPYLELNTTDAEVTSTDWVDPDNSGFIVNGTTINASSGNYIFYAIA